jgi:hypothetical protein
VEADLAEVQEVMGIGVAHRKEMISRGMGNLCTRKNREEMHRTAIPQRSITAGELGR